MRNKVSALFTIFIALSPIIYLHSFKPVIKFEPHSKVELVILGNVQDAGSPHIACTKKCCSSLHKKGKPKRKVVSMGIIDYLNNKKFLIDATPDFPEQVFLLNSICCSEDNQIPDAIFLTHAHIGHYTGLMYLGKEGMNAHSVLIYLMPRFKSFFENNGPWNQLVNLNNVSLIALKNNTTVDISTNVSVIPFIVPHRDEYSETVGYKIIGKHKSAIFIPDIDKWEKWEVNIIDQIKEVDYAFIDGTFYDQQELPNRKMSEIPHPFIVESIELFSLLNETEKNKIYFIHLNHTNPTLEEKSKESKWIKKLGFNVAREGERFDL
ncbi:MAG: MBL fold metallo-hydrolase [Saprospiraceae bacterium]